MNSQVIYSSLTLSLSILSFCFPFIPTYAAEKEIISTVLIVKGNVKAKLESGQIVDLKTTMGLKEGSYIKTEAQSFAKLVFVDRSYMTIGPESLVKISNYSKKNPGIISLLKGQLRSQVTKNYMEMEDKTKSKLFIRTKNAAMGIRGTDFQVHYSDDSEKTTLLTFEGKVAFNRIEDNNTGKELSPRQLDRLLERKERVLVSQDEISNVTKKEIGPQHPAKIDTRMLEHMKHEKIPKPFFEEKRANQNRNENRSSERELSKEPIYFPPFSADKKNDFKQEMKQNFRQELKKDMRNDIKKEIQRDLKRDLPPPPPPR